MNLSLKNGEWAFTYHQNRYAIDYRYDGFFGFWFESVLHDVQDKLLPYGTVGMDYTFNLFNGIHCLSETMIIENIDKQFISSVVSTSLQKLV